MRDMHICMPKHIQYNHSVQLNGKDNMEDSVNINHVCKCHCRRCSATPNSEEPYPKSDILHISHILSVMGVGLPFWKVTVNWEYSIQVYTVYMVVLMLQEIHDCEVSAWNLNVSTFKKKSLIINEIPTKSRRYSKPLQCPNNILPRTRATEQGD